MIFYRAIVRKIREIILCLSGYHDTDDTVWHVYPDNTCLLNYVSSPYNDGYATYTGYW